MAGAAWPRRRLSVSGRVAAPPIGLAGALVVGLPFAAASARTVLIAEREREGRNVCGANTSRRTSKRDGQKFFLRRRISCAEAIADETSKKKVAVRAANKPSACTARTLQPASQAAQLLRGCIELLLGLLQRALSGPLEGLQLAHTLPSSPPLLESVRADAIPLLLIKPGECRRARNTSLIEADFESAAPAAPPKRRRPTRSRKTPSIPYPTSTHRPPMPPRLWPALLHLAPRSAPRLRKPGDGSGKRSATPKRRLSPTCWARSCPDRLLSRRRAPPHPVRPSRASLACSRARAPLRQTRQRAPEPRSKVASRKSTRP